MVKTKTLFSVSPPSSTWFILACSKYTQHIQHTVKYRVSSDNQRFKTTLLLFISYLLFFTINLLTCVHFGEATVSSILSTRAASIHTMLNNTWKRSQTRLNYPSRVWVSEGVRLNTAPSICFWGRDAAQLIVCASYSAQDATGNQMERKVDPSVAAGPVKYWKC